jgi:succinyl-diaminopimelate desuccinylase
VIEFGPTNATIHKVNECVRVEEVEQLPRIYRRILEILLPD